MFVFSSPRKVTGKPLLRISFWKDTQHILARALQRGFTLWGSWGISQQQDQQSQPWGAQCHFSLPPTEGCSHSLGPRCVFLLFRMLVLGKTSCIFLRSLYLLPSVCVYCSAGHPKH